MNITDPGVYVHGKVVGCVEAGSGDACTGETRDWFTVEWDDGEGGVYELDHYADEARIYEENQRLDDAGQCVDGLFCE